MSKTKILSLKEYKIRLSNRTYEKYLKVINNGCYGSAPFTRDSSSQINKILSGGYCVPVGNYYSDAMWIINHYELERFDTLIKN